MIRIHMFGKFKKNISLNIKNLIGWRTDRKIIVLSVDDYGNVRLDSKKARKNLNQAGIPVNNRFDAFDTLETREDLEALYEVLASVKDKNGNHAVFTPFAIPCNIDFEKIRETGYQKYYYELLPQTFKKLAAEQPSAYHGAWSILQEGMKTGLMAPQFHGREHLNVKVFEEKLIQQDSELLTQLKNRSFTTISDTRYKPISALAAFDFWAFEENKKFHAIIEDGLNKFEKVFGYRAQNFTPPAYNAHQVLYETLKKNGIRFIDIAFIAKEHQGSGTYKKQINYTGKTGDALCKMVRNVVFEPTVNQNVDWPSYAMKQIKAAFRWNRPAIISSHRVNFCGHISEKIGRQG